MRSTDLCGINMAQSVVGDNFSGNIQDQSSQRISLIAVGVDSPIALIEIFVHSLSYFDDDTSFCS